MQIIQCPSLLFDFIYQIENHEFFIQFMTFLSETEWI